MQRNNESRGQFLRGQSGKSRVLLFEQIEVLKNFFHHVVDDFFIRIGVAE